MRQLYSRDMTNSKTCDVTVRRAMIARLNNRDRRSSGTHIFEEFGLRHGAVRADIAVLNGRLHVYEIKSDLDSLKRLPRQANLLSTVCDKATLIVAQRHLRKAMTIVPGWWGVLCATIGSRGAVNLSTHRRGSSNPQPDELSIAKLLWRDEALQLLEEVGRVEGVRSKPRRFLYQRITETLDVDSLRRAVYTKIKQRTNWRFDELQKSCDD